MDPYLVRRIVPGEWRQLRAIRLEALREAPIAFSSSYADVSARTDDVWSAEAATGATSTDSAIFVARAGNDAWVGMASVSPLREVPDHAHIHTVYVRPTHRGPAGLAARLMDQAIRFAQEHIDVSWLTLGVHENNARALAFYRRIGFEMTGKVIPYAPNPGEKCYIMAYRNFRPSPAPAPFPDDHRLRRPKPR